MAIDGFEALADLLDDGGAQISDTRIGVVTRVDDEGTPWVAFSGSDAEMPVHRSYATVKPGDSVPVRVRKGRSEIPSNASDLPASTSVVFGVSAQAEQATVDAITASTAAQNAIESADTAQQAADSAQQSLKSVVQGATTVEKAVSVMQTALEAVVDYDPDTDETTEYFWHDANGAHVLGDTSGYRNDTDSSGMDIVDVNTEKSVAHFGADGSRICGPDFVPLFDIDPDGSVKLVDVMVSAPPSDSASFSENVTLTKTVSIPEYESGTDITLTVSSGSGILYQNALIAFGTDSSSGYSFDMSGATIAGSGMTLSTYANNIVRASSVTLAAGTAATAYGTVDGIAYRKLFSANATINYRFDIAYDGSSEITFTHTIGIEWTSTPQSEYYPRYQAGYMRTVGKVTMRSPAYSLGTRLGSSGDYSAIVGEGLIAQSDDQLAIGRYNEADTDGDYAVIVGNGTADNARSNALAVGWDGNVRIAGDVQDMSGNAKYLKPSDTPTKSESGNATAGTNITLNYCHIATYGKVAQMFASITTTAAIPAGSTVLTLASGKRPVYEVFVLCANPSIPFYANPNGTVIARNALTNATNYYLQAMYLLA